MFSQASQALVDYLYSRWNPEGPGEARFFTSNNFAAPAHVLATIYQGDSAGRALLGRDGNDREVWNVLRARKEGRIFCPSEEEERCVTFQSEVGDEGSVFPALQFQSDIFEILSEGRFGTARVRIRAVVDRSDPYAIETLFYQMN